MTKKQTLIATACFASLCGALHGQTTEKNVAFQYVVADEKIRMEGLAGANVTGKPVSATEERHTLQVLGDGTRIDKKETDKYFRDDQGRTRIEREGGSTVVISDPVAGFAAEMNSNSKVARRMIVRKSIARTSLDNAALEKLKAEASAAKTATIAGAGGTAGNIVYARSEAITALKPAADAQRTATEDLGTQIVNGVPAQGSRTTITIPVGQIGNDREIRVVSERWYSADLQMLVKSSNNDPRFGETTYQLTDIVQGAQDPALFQIPADFSVNGLR